MEDEQDTSMTTTEEKIHCTIPDTQEDVPNFQSFKTDLPEDKMLTIICKGEPLPVGVGKPDAIFNYEFTLCQKDLSISHMICATLDGDPQLQILELPRLEYTDKFTMNAFVEYAIHHKATDLKKPLFPLRSQEFEDLVDDKWDADFIKEKGKSYIYLGKLLLLANFLGVDGLIHAICSHLAQKLKAKRSAPELGCLDKLIDEEAKNGFVVEPVDKDDEEDELLEEEIKKPE